MKKGSQLTIVQADLDDSTKGRLLTEQYERATGGMKEVLIFGAMMMQLRSEHPELAAKGRPAKKSATRGALSVPEPLTLSKWLEKHAPKVKGATARRFLAVTEAIAEDYVKIVGAKIAKQYALPELVCGSDLPRAAASKQLELFEWVNGTSQRSWLDRFQTTSPQKRGRDARGNAKPKPKTVEELAADAEAEITTVLNLLDGWFVAHHHTRVLPKTRATATAVLEGAITKLNAVK